MSALDRHTVIMQLEAAVQFAHGADAARINVGVDVLENMLEVLREPDYTQTFEQENMRVTINTTGRDRRVRHHVSIALDGRTFIEGWLEAPDIEPIERIDR